MSLAAGLRKPDLFLALAKARSVFSGSRIETVWARNAGLECVRPEVRLAQRMAAPRAPRGERVARIIGVVVLAVGLILTVRALVA